MNGQPDLEGLSALVTAATPGIGQAAAEEPGRRGTEIVVDGRDAARGSAVAGTITAEDGKARARGPAPRRHRRATHHVQQGAGAEDRQEPPAPRRHQRYLRRREGAAAEPGRPEAMRRPAGQVALDDLRRHRRQRVRPDRRVDPAVVTAVLLTDQGDTEAEAGSSDGRRQGQRARPFCGGLPVRSAVRRLDPGG
jgi:hypothetical protein